VGTNGNTPYDRPDTVPARSDDVLLTTTLYNNAGQACLMTDPAGRNQRQTFDALGRLVESVQNYIDGVVDATHPDEDVTVRRTYTADGQLATLTAVNPTTGDQTTQYLYGTTLCNSSIARSDLLRAEIYPDSTDSGDDASPPHANAAYDRVEYGYNRQGQVIRKRDQNQTLHVYDYDLLGRRVQDRVVELGSGVDGQIRRIAWTFDGRGRQLAITSYTHPCVGGGSVANQVVFQYNEANQVVAEYQQHAGAVDMSRTPQVQYQYDTAAHGFRPTALVYPNGRTLYYEYNSGTDTALNRISALAELPSTACGRGAGGEGASSSTSASSSASSSDSLQPLVTYDYLGLNTIVRVIYPEPGLRWGLIGGSATDLYGRMDRFGRVVDHVWRNCATATNVVEIQHGYDRVGNRLWRNDAVALAAGQKLDELYGYDGLNQLVSLNRGQLDDTRTALVTDTKTFAESWSLDMTGNWSAYQEDTNGDGTWNLSQTRTHDAANEITAISTTVGDSWISPTHDRNGNMIAIPSPLSPVTSFACVYDAWNRLVRVTNSSTTVAEYQYDGRNYRVVKAVYVDGMLSEVRHSYYNSGWQELEERVVTSLATDPWAQSPVSQYVWGLRYIDELVLRDRDTSATLDGVLEERLYAIQDANWNVVALADMTGEIVERYSYSAYGEASVLTGNCSPVSESSYEWHHLFTSRQFESETALGHYRARYYRADCGRFLGRDALDASYNYTEGRPTDMVDPLGLWSSQGGNIYEAESDQDTLQSLARRITNDERDWVCVWPSGKPKQSPLWTNYPKGTTGACADVSNLLTGDKTLGKSHKRKAIMVQAPDSDGALRALGKLFRSETGWNFSRWGSGDEAAEHIANAAKFGETPIEQLVIGAHGAPEATFVANRDGTRSFSASQIVIWGRKQKEAWANDTNMFKHAVKKHGPPRCWFTPDAYVYAIGCTTARFAQEFASNNLRKTAHAQGTQLNMWGSFTQIPGSVNWSVGFDGQGGYGSIEGLLSATGGAWSTPFAGGL
jgi:RHS repeat-associated protein